MTVVYTTNLALAQPTVGTEDGTWGDDVNNGLTSYLDIAIAGGLAVTVTVSDVTLANTQGTSSATNIGSTTAQYAILNVSGAMTAARNLIVPSSSKWYIINNSTTGGYTLTVKGAATTGVGVVNNERALIAWNGSDYVKLASMISGLVPVASGGTGLGSGTSGGVLAYTAAGTLASSGALTANALVVGGGAGAVPTSAATAAGIITFLGTPSSSNLAAAMLDETGSGALVFGTSPTVNNPTITNYVESVVSIGTVSSTSTLSLTNGTVQTATLTASTACTFTMPTATAGKSFILLLKQAAATGNGTATFTGVKWNSLGAPTITATAGKMDILTFVSDGTNWYGSYTQGYTP